jgi:hypothetical protein
VGGYCARRIRQAAERGFRPTTSPQGPGQCDPLLASHRSIRRRRNQVEAIAGTIRITSLSRHSGRLPFLLPYARIELLIRTMLTETWAPEAWPVVKHEFAKALKLRSHIARAGWWN